MENTGRFIRAMRSNRGYSMVQWMIIILIGVVLYASYIVIPVYLSDYQLKKGLTRMAMDMAGETDTHHVYQRMSKKIFVKIGIDLTAEQLKISRDGNKLIVDVDYEVPVEFLLYGPHTFKFVITRMLLQLR